MTRNHTTTLKAAATGAALLALTAASQGAGFQLAERSATGLGRAFSGESAIADDASVIASNPAGMSLLDDMSFAVGASCIRPGVDVSGTGALGPTSDKGVIPEALVPFSYFTKRLNDKFTAGLGIFTTYGLKTDYSTAFATSAATDYSELLSFNVNPSLSYRVNDQLSIGVGFNALYAEGEITSLTPGLPPLGGTNLFALKGDDWGFGFNVGVLYEITNRTRVGLHYRSAVELEIEGTADLGAALGGPATVPATLDIELPDTIEFSIYHEVNDRLAVHGDVLWTNWSRFKTLAPITGTPADPALAVDESWSDTFRFSIGATYAVNDKLTLRCGLAYDESPVDNDHRTLRIPDADRIWASVGASYKINECYTCDIGYTHIFADDAKVIAEAAGGNERYFGGKASGDVDLLAAGIHGSF